MTSDQRRLIFRGTAAKAYPGPALIARILGALSLSALLMLPESAAYARFNPPDALEVDREDKLNSEYYNDILSYRHPWYWDRAWISSETGYRSGYGSLDIRRFYTTEEIRLRHQRAGKAGFSFTQVRLETMNEIRTQQEVRLSAPLGSSFHIALLGDGGTLKKWGDLGVALAYGLPTDSTWLDFSYWSVDHYYNSKVGIEGNSYAKKTWSFRLQAHQNPLSGPGAILDFEYDSPVDWHRRSELRRFFWQQTRGQLTLLAPLWDGEFTAGLSFWGEQKSEELSQSQDSDRWDRGIYYLKKNLKRRTRGGELSASSLPSSGNPGYYLGFWLVRRLADYSWETTDPPEPLPSDAEAFSPGSDRREGALIALQALKNQSFSDFLWGFQYNRIAWDDNVSLRKGELKLQTAFDVLLTERVHLLINSTWDLDEIYRERSRSFRPWGGGNLQIQAVF